MTKYVYLMTDFLTMQIGQNLESENSQSRLMGKCLIFLAIYWIWRKYKMFVNKIAIEKRAGWHIAG